MNESTFWQRRQRGLSRRALIGAAGATAGTALLAACGTRGGGVPAGKSARSTAPKLGGAYAEPSKADPPSFDPSTRFIETAQRIGWTMDRLLSWKVGPNVHYSDLELTPNLADKWETPDAQVYTFQLHPGVTFANLPPVNGRPLTSADVKYTLEYVSRTGQFSGAKAAPSAAMFEGLESIDTPDATTVVVKFKAPFAPFLNSIASEFAGILPKEAAAMDGGFDKNTIGSGPWHLDTASSSPGQHWTFKRNPTYFRRGLPYMDQVSDLVISDDSTALAAFETRQLDLLYFTGLTEQLVQQVKKTLPSAVVFDYLNPDGKHIYMNVSRPPLNDARVRKALILSIDRDAILKTLSGGKGQWSLSGSMPGLFTDDETRKLLPHDPAQAKQLISAAGYPNGLDINVIYPGQKYGQELIDQWQLIQQQVKQSGINLVLQSIDATEESTRKRTGDFQLEMAPKPLQGDLDGIQFEMFYSKSAGNYGRIDDPQLDELVMAQRREPDQTKRRDIWRQVVQRVNDMAWSTDLYYTTSYYLWQSYLRDIYPNQGYNGRPLVQSWLDK